MGILENREFIESKIHYQFKSKDLLALAFIHRSFWNENQQIVEGHNERLEFLGDSILGLIVAHYLYRHYPFLAEGVLSELRARLVKAPACASYAKQLHLGASLLLGKGEMHQGGEKKESILADLFEALVGAIYLDGGLEAAEGFFLFHFEEAIKQTVSSPARNWKAELQDRCQKKLQQIPTYQLISESGPSHKKIFHVGVWVDGIKKGEGVGSSKKEAQTLAAKDALEQMKED